MARLKSRLKVGVLISGRGSNLQALIDACARNDYPAEIALVVSNEATAYGLNRADAAGIATRTIDHGDYESREIFESAIHQALTDNGVELVCLAGFMRLLTAGFVEGWRDRLVNIHPSLLPAFKGLNTHERVLEAGVRFTGCTVHFVRPAMDDGPIIMQAAVPVMPDDTPDSLAARVLAAEHVCYPEALRLIATQRIRIVNERVMIDGVGNPAEALFNPAPKR